MPTPRNLELLLLLDGKTIHTACLVLSEGGACEKTPSKDAIRTTESLVVFGIGLKIPTEGVVRVTLSLSTDPTSSPKVSFVHVNGHTQAGEHTEPVSFVSLDGVFPSSSPVRITQTVYDSQGRVIREVEGDAPHDSPPPRRPKPNAPPDDPHIVE